MADTRTRSRPPQVRVSFDRWINVDNFAGGGGATTGIEAALGKSCDIAINHDPKAIAMHAANHPETLHYTTDVWEVDPREACQGRRVNVAWFSPDCTHFSRAKGTKPVKKNIRGLAWVVTRWAKAVRPRIIIVENVPEFVTWGPLLTDDQGAQRPDPTRAGEHFTRWVGQLRAAGYHVEWRQLTACDYGAPTKRTRLFVIARCDGQPIVWPEESHGDGRGAPYRTAAEIIDWSIPCPSIFDRPRPLAENTMRRIADGILRYVIDAEEPFIVRHGHYSKRTGQGKYFRGQSLRDPLGVVCATNDKNLVMPFLRRAGTEDVGSPEPLIATFLAKHYGGVVGHGMERPLGTVTAVDHHALVGALLIKYYGSGSRNWQRVDGPLHTVTAKSRFGLVELRGTQYEIVDIGMRMLQPRELFNAQGFPTSYRVEDVEHDGKLLTKTDQTRLAGNSVCPNVSEVLVGANV